MGKLVLCLILIAVSAACSGGASKDDPKKTLSDYISLSFSVKSPDDRNRLASYLTGEAKTRLSAWSDEQFREALIDNKRQFLKIAFNEVKPLSPREVNITYELTYVDQGKGKDAKVTNRKLCQMVQEQGRWLIRQVTNIKELVEYQNEMSLP